MKFKKEIKPTKPVDNNDYSFWSDLKDSLDEKIDNEETHKIEEILRGLNLLLEKEDFRYWAANKLSMVFGKGFGVEKDIEKSIKYMEIAADEGSFSAKINIGKLYLGGSPFREKNLTKALAIFTEVNNYYLYKGEYDATIQIIKTEMGIE
jgi:TPR repeat protein